MEKPLLTAMRLSDNRRFGLKYLIKWTYKSVGKKGLTDRFKVLKAWFLKVLSGDHEYDPKIYYRAVHRYGKLYPSFKGSFHAVLRFEAFIKSKDYASIRAFLSVLNCYQAFEGPIQSEIPKMVKEDILYDPPKLDTGKLEEMFLSFLTYSVKRHLHVGRLIDSDIESKLAFRWTASTVLLNRPTRVFPEALTGTYEDYILLYPERIQSNAYIIARYRELNDPKNPRPVQKITAIGERGMKTRLVAVSEPVDMSIGDILACKLRDILSSIPMDCSFDQEKGRKWITSELRRGNSLASVDLKQASWHLPLVWQNQILKTLEVPYPFIRLCLESDFVIDINGRWEYISCPSGQAMGLPMSFPLFTLTLHLLLMGLCDNLKIDYTYRLLGDDLVIGNRDLFTSFVKVCEEWSIPISWNKTFSYNNQLAEFAGSLIYRGYDITPIRWTEISTRRLNSAYRGRPLLYEYFKVLRKYTWDMCDYASTNTKCPKGIRGRGAILRKAKLYQDILGMLRYVPIRMGGLYGCPLRMKRSKVYLKMALTYIEAYEAPVSPTIWKTKVYTKDASSKHMSLYIKDMVEDEPFGKPEPGATIAQLFHSINLYYENKHALEFKKKTKQQILEDTLRKSKKYTRIRRVLGEPKLNNLLRQNGYISTIPALAADTEFIEYKDDLKDSIPAFHTVVCYREGPIKDSSTGFIPQNGFRLAFLRRRRKRTQFQKLINGIDLTQEIRHLLKMVSFENVVSVPYKLRDISERNERFEFRNGSVRRRIYPV